MTDTLHPIVVALIEVARRISDRPSVEFDPEGLSPLGKPYSECSIHEVKFLAAAMKLSGLVDQVTGDFLASKECQRLLCSDYDGGGDDGGGIVVPLRKTA